MKIAEGKYFWVEVQILEKSAVASHGPGTLRLFRKNEVQPGFFPKSERGYFYPHFLCLPNEADANADQSVSRCKSGSAKVLWSSGSECSIKHFEKE